MSAKIRHDVPERFLPPDPVDRRVLDHFGPLAYRHDASGDRLYHGGILFNDGRNVYFLLWEGGGRWASVAHETNWALEEHFEGEAPAEHLADGVEVLWRRIIESLRRGNAAAREAEGRARG